MWSCSPFLRLLIPLSVGIILQEQIHSLITFIIAVILSVTTLIISFQKQSIHFAWRMIPGICIICWFLFLGQRICFLEDIRNDPNWFANFKSHSYIIKISSNPETKKQKISFEGEVILIEEKGIWKNTCGTMMINADSSMKTLRRGTIFLINDTPKIIKAEGSFASYLHHKNIYHKIFLKKGHFSIIEENKKYTLIDTVRKYILNVIDNYIKESNSNALSKALLIGYRSEMDKSTLNAFRNTGVIHVISVSGMHLALIYVILNSILKFFFGKSVSGRIQRICINLIILWGFSFLCGGAPSILRSALMFSFILIGELFKKNNITANAIAGSAFCLLVINPFMIYDLGFLLSYGAVTGLHIFNKPISHVFYPNNKILLYGWEVFSTTIAAQILTAPIIIYQFGKLPTLFLLTNLIAVPITSLLLLILIFLCMAAPFHECATYTGLLIIQLSKWLVNKMNSLGNLPFATIAIQFDLMETIFLYMMIIFGTLFIFSRKQIFFWGFLSTDLIWPLYVLFIKWVNIQ